MMESLSKVGAFATEKAKQEVGKTYGFLTVIDVKFEPHPSVNGKNRATAFCRCAKTGLEDWVPVNYLKSGDTKSLSSRPRHPNEVILDDEVKKRLAKNTITLHKVQLKSGDVVTYYKLTFDGKRRYLHQVVWFLAYGHYPEFSKGRGDRVDHINKNTADNRLENLRIDRNGCGVNENSCNRAKVFTINGKPASSRFKGVCYNKQRGKWLASLKHDRRIVFQKNFPTEIEAAIAYAEFADRMNEEKGCGFSGHWEQLAFAGIEKPNHTPQCPSHLDFPKA